MAFVIIARGDGRAYILTELSSAAIYLALSIPAYRYAGFAALGLAYVLWYGAYCAITCAVCLRRYGMRLSGSSLRLLLGTVGAGCLCLLLCELIGNWLTLAITLPPSAYFAYKNLLRREAGPRAGVHVGRWRRLGGGRGRGWICFSKYHRCSPKA